jgi:hypothetical protein
VGQVEQIFNAFLSQARAQMAAGDSFGVLSSSYQASMLIWPLGTDRGAFQAETNLLIDNMLADASQINDVWRTNDNTQQSLDFVYGVLMPRLSEELAQLGAMVCSTESAPLSPLSPLPWFTYHRPPGPRPRHPAAPVHVRTPHPLAPGTQILPAAPGTRPPPLHVTLANPPAHALPMASSRPMSRQAVSMRAPAPVAKGLPWVADSVGSMAGATPGRPSATLIGIAQVMALAWPGCPPNSTLVDIFKQQTALFQGTYSQEYQVSIATDGVYTSETQGALQQVIADANANQAGALPIVAPAPCTLAPVAPPVAPIPVPATPVTPAVVVAPVAPSVAPAAPPATPPAATGGISTGAILAIGGIGILTLLLWKKGVKGAIRALTD